MPTLKEIRKIRVEKLEKLKSLGIDPYPAETKRTHKIGDALKDFKKLSKDEKQIVVAGRITGWRGHGGIVFLDVVDDSGKIQVLIKKHSVGEESFKFLKDYFDLADFIEIKGTLIITKTGEESLEAINYRMLSKSLLPLPEKWHGIKDVEERYRKRYLDLIFNEDIKTNFVKRSKIISSLREFLESNDFMEVETPILQPVYGGARAKPFVTHLNAMDMDIYLRVAPETYLKRLLIGGFEKVYEIGKCFRNEGVDKFHNPDFTMLEFYWAYADYKDMMKLVEKMFLYVQKQVNGSSILEFSDQKIDLKGPWQRIEFGELIEKYTGIKIDEINKEGLAKIAKELGVKVQKGSPKYEIADEIYKKYCREKIVEPTFIIHHPHGFQTLAKHIDDQKLATIQLVIGGVELINAFSELNDSEEQKRRFKKQEELFAEGYEEASRGDDAFIEALEHGMPPAAGFGMGIDRFVLLLTNSQNLREIILFPTMKPKI